MSKKGDAFRLFLYFGLVSMLLFLMYLLVHVPNYYCGLEGVGAIPNCGRQVRQLILNGTIFQR